MYVHVCVYAFPSARMRNVDSDSFWMHVDCGPAECWRFLRYCKWYSHLILSAVLLFSQHVGSLWWASDLSLWHWCWQLDGRVPAPGRREAGTGVAGSSISAPSTTIWSPSRQSLTQWATTTSSTSSTNTNPRFCEFHNRKMNVVLLQFKFAYFCYCFLFFIFNADYSIWWCTKWLMLLLLSSIT